MGAGEFWVTPEFVPAGTPGDLNDAQFFVTGFSTMEPALNFTKDGHLSVHLKVAGVSDADAMLVAQQRFCAVLTPSRYRLVGIKATPAVNNPSGGCFGPAEFLVAAKRLVERRRRTGSLVGTLAFCDIVDSTALIAKMGDAPWAELLTGFRTMVRENVRRGGQELAVTGDGFVLFWPGVDSTTAVETMLTIDRLAQQLGLGLRSGFHWGEFRKHQGSVAGIEVHLAARVMGHAGPGQLVATGSVIDLLDGDGIRVCDPAPLELKGVVPTTWYLYKLERHTA